MTTALLPSPDNGPDAGAADTDTTTADATDTASRFQVRRHAGVGMGSNAFIVVAVDGDRISRISTHPMSSAQHATVVAELLNSDRSEAANTPRDALRARAFRD